MIILQLSWGSPCIPDLGPLVVTCQSTRSPAWGEGLLHICCPVTPSFVYMQLILLFLNATHKGSILSLVPNFHLLFFCVYGRPWYSSRVYSMFRFYVKVWILCLSYFSWVKRPYLFILFWDSRCYKKNVISILCKCVNRGNVYIQYTVISISVLCICVNIKGMLTFHIFVLYQLYLWKNKGACFYSYNFQIFHCWYWKYIYL